MKQQSTRHVHEHNSGLAARRATTTPPSLHQGASAVSAENAARCGHRLERIRISPEERGVQAKLVVGEANNASEHEAEQVASRVMGMSDTSLLPTPAPAVRATPFPGSFPPSSVPPASAPPTVQGDAESAQRDAERQASDRDLSGSFEAGGEVEGGIAAKRGGGSPLQAGARAFFEPRFGAGFGGVRIHADGAAGELSRSIGARAFTTGSDIFFGHGQYQPNSSGGRHLLAHELTHVVQQGGATQHQAAPNLPPSGTSGGGQMARHIVGQTEGKDSANQNASNRLDSGSGHKRQQQRAEVTQRTSAERHEIGRSLLAQHITTSPQPNVLQRAVGFEFETGYKLHREEKGVEEGAPSLVPLKKYDVVKQFPNNVNLTADETSTGESSVEMVLDPPVEESAPKQFIAALNTLEKVGGILDELKPSREEKKSLPKDEHGAPITNPVPLHTVSGIGASKGYWVTPAPSGFTGVGQITGGIRFDKLFTFMEDTQTEDQSLKDAQGNPAKDPDGKLVLVPHHGAKYNIAQFKHGDAAKSVKGTRELQEVKDSPELRGLITLLATYIRGGAAPTSTKQEVTKTDGKQEVVENDGKQEVVENDGKQEVVEGEPELKKDGKEEKVEPVKDRDLLNYAKLISGPYMARTDFGTMFRMLPEDDYMRVIRDPNAFVQLVLKAAGVSGTEKTRLFDRGLRKSYDPKSDYYKVNHIEDFPALQLSREDWIRRVTMGNDSIKSHGQAPDLAARLGGLGSLGERTDQVGNDPKPAKGKKVKGSGIIIELRQLNNDGGAIAPKNFARRARAIFDYIVALNAEPRT